MVVLNPSRIWCMRLDLGTWGGFLRLPTLVLIASSMGVLDAMLAYGRTALGRVRHTRRNMSRMCFVLLMPLCALFWLLTLCALNLVDGRIECRERLCRRLCDWISGTKFLVR